MEECTEYTDSTNWNEGKEVIEMKRRRRFSIILSAAVVDVLLPPAQNIILLALEK